MPKSISNFETFVVDQPVLYKTPAGVRVCCRFQRYLKSSRTRVVVALPDPAVTNHPPRIRLKTVNVRSLSPTLEQRRDLLQIRRAQAVTTYPFLERLLRSPEKLRLGNKTAARTPRWRFDELSPAERRRIVVTVDAGDALLPVLTDILNASPWVLRHLSRHSRIYCSQFHGNLVTAVQLLNRTTPEWAPTCRTALRSFAHGIDALGYLLPAECLQSARALRSLMRYPPTCIALPLFVNFLTGLTGWIDGPTPSAIPIGSRLGVTTAQECLELCRRWTRALRAQSGRSVPPGVDWSIARGPRPAVEWPTLFSGCVRRSDHDFECVGDRDALAATAHTLRNCLNEYGEAALAGKLHLVTVSIGKDPIAVLDIRRKGGSCCLAQAAGPKKTALAQLTTSAIEGFVSELNSDTSMARDIHSPRTPEALLARRQSTRALLALEYRPEHHDPFTHFQSLAEIYGEAGFAKYQSCLEAAPGRGTLYADALRAAHEAQPRQCTVSGIRSSRSQRALSNITAMRQSSRAS